MVAPAVVSLERHGQVATIFLDRPDAANAMGPAFWTELPAAVGEAAEDPEVRVVVVAARGAHFSVGLDLKAMAPLLLGGSDAGGGVGAGREAGSGSPAGSAADLYRRLRSMQAAVSAVADCPKPVIAAVHGYCLGSGVDLITACDLRLASADAVFSVRETKMAIVADLGSLQRLPEIVGRGHLNELVLTGRDVGAARAAEIGLVNEVFADPEALAEGTRRLAEEIAANSPFAVQGVKAVLRSGRRTGEGLDYVAAWNAAFLRSEDLSEAVAAFFEKRPPRFAGR